MASPAEPPLAPSAPPPPLSLYVHIPWCEKKCPYCDFNSHLRPSRIPEEEYVDAVVRDVEAALPRLWGRRVVSVFIGGGTPSLFSVASLDRLLSEIRARLPITPAAEITIEVNPGATEAGKYAAFRDIGITRISVGAQSFSDEYLAALGRIHDGATALRGVETAASVFDNFNVDLMHGLPGQCPEDAVADVEAALQFSPPHVSAYALALEPGTPFGERPPPRLPDHDTAAETGDAVAHALAGAGLARYEVAAYALPGSECVHNLNYWKFGDYLGVGAGAHSKLTVSGRIFREERWRHPSKYMSSPAEGQTKLVDEVRTDRLAFEFMLNALRLREGFTFDLMTQRAGLDSVDVRHTLDEASRRGFMDADHLGAKPTELGWRFLNDLLELFLDDDGADSVARVPILPVSSH